MTRTREIGKKGEMGKKKDLEEARTKGCIVNKALIHKAVEGEIV